MRCCELTPRNSVQEESERDRATVARESACYDDNSRIAFANVIPNDKKRSATTVLKNEYETLGIKVERVTTDDDSCYKSFCLPQGQPAPLPLMKSSTSKYTNDCSMTVCCVPRDQRTAWPSRMSAGVCI